MQLHILNKHRQITHAPGHIAAFLAAPIRKFPECFGKGFSPARQVPVMNAGEGRHLSVHFGVVFRGDIQAQLVHRLKILV